MSYHDHHHHLATDPDKLMHYLKRKHFAPSDVPSIERGLFKAVQR